jgi:transcriptional regulator with XRE-family HTH domain
MSKKMIVRTPLTPEQMEESATLKRLYEAAKRGHGLTQAEFGARYEIGSQGAVWQYLNGRTALNLKAATGFAKGIGCSVSDFSPSLASEIEALSRHAATLPEEDEFADIKRLDVKVAAGHGCIPHLEEELGSLKFRRAFLRSAGVSEANAVVITVKGASMEPTIPDGAVLLVNRANREPRPNAIYVFHRPGNGLVVKRVVKSAGQWVARSDNDDRDAFPDFPFEEGITLIGRAVWVGAKL